MTDDGLQMTCPQCGEPRLRHFRICRACGFDFEAAMHEHDPRALHRIANRVRRNPSEYLLGVAVGLFCAWAAMQSYLGSAAWTIGPVAAAAVALGCPFVAALIAYTGLARRLVARSAYFREAVLPGQALAGAEVFIAVVEPPN